MPKYFFSIYSDYRVEYSTLNSLVVSLFGFISALTGGYVSDIYEKEGIFMTKAYVTIFCGLAGIPMIMISLLYQSNFWVSISALALEYLFAEGWVGPSITMIINTIKNYQHYR